MYYLLMNSGKEPQTNSFNGIELLQRELTRRISTNPKYSLRAFARALDVSPATLSLILSRKIRLSKRNIEKMAKTLALEPAQLAALRNQVTSKKKRAFGIAESINVTMEIFTVLSEWYHFAILSLLELPKSSDSPRWISKKLGITLTEAKLAVDRLKNLNLISQVNGNWMQTAAPMRIGNLLSNAAARKFQKQLIEKALNSLERGIFHR